MKLTRRNFLKLSGSGAAYAAMGGLSMSLGSINAFAADSADDYKAIVCVFLYGGMDCHDTIIPYDDSERSQYETLRGSLLADYKGARDKSKLLKLTPSNAEDFNGREFALPPEMSGLHKLFAQKSAAVVGNVGPLVMPINATNYSESGGANQPARLFSHNDQQASWIANAPEGAQYGWGGSFSDAMRAKNTTHEFSAITNGAEGLFLSGAYTSPFQVDPNGVTEIEIMEEIENPTLREKLKKHFKGTLFNGQNLFAKDIANAHSNAYDLNSKFKESLATTNTNSTYPTSELGTQLQSVAKTIAARKKLGVGRQIFIVSQGGYDTHDGQALALPKLQKELDEAISTFFNDLQSQGMQNNTTLFTASEFGRTLSVNGNGTDHGWGGHHFVVGGAVEGRKIYGEIPEAKLDHLQDSGDGRLIPTTSIEQFASPLGKWFGLSDTQLREALPNLSNFSEALSYMKS